MENVANLSCHLSESFCTWIAWEIKQKGAAAFGSYCLTGARHACAGNRGGFCKASNMMAKFFSCLWNPTYKWEELRNAWWPLQVQLWTPGSAHCHQLHSTSCTVRNQMRVQNQKLFKLLIFPPQQQADILGRKNASVDSRQTDIMVYPVCVQSLAHIS